MEKMVTLLIPVLLALILVRLLLLPVRFLLKIGLHSLFYHHLLTSPIVST